MTKAVEALLEEDIKKLYLGNLNTVEFDIKLPSKGENGSAITWVSDNELFLKSDGTVTRPCNGIGDRKVHLCAQFKLGNLKKEKIYEVHILEEPCKVKIVEILPLQRKAEKGKLTALPGAVVLLADNGHYFSRQVSWEGGNERKFSVCGNYDITGRVKDEELIAKLRVEVLNDFLEERKETIPSVWALDSGETVLLPGSCCYEAAQSTILYLKHIDDDQMLYNFREAAGLDTHGAPKMAGWDSPECLLRGHTTGHYLSALALCYRETGDEEIRKKLSYLVCGLEECQKKFSQMAGFCEGYIGGYSEAQFDLLEAGESYPNIWAPYYTLHKLLAGLLDTYCYTGEKKALDIAKGAGMWVYNRLKRLNRETCERMWDTYIAGEFGGINESLAELFELTAKQEYIETAKMFDNDRLFIPMQEQFDILEGMHVNQHIPQMIGCMELFRTTGEKKYYDIAEFFWKAVTKGHLFVNGGVGENEMFFEPNGEASHLTKETAEFCASYNMLKLTKILYQYNPDVLYMDYYERTMLNHIAAGREKETAGGISYFYPMAPGSSKDARYENSCCHGTGMESQMKYTESIYFYTKDTLYVNLFLNSKTRWMEQKITVTQQVKEDPGIIRLSLEGPGMCRLKVRCPYWCGGTYEVLVNGGKMLAKCDSDGYINIQKTREKEDVEIRFQCTFRIETAADNPGIAALAYGPYILAALSESEDFLEFDVKEKHVVSELSARRKSSSELMFLTGKENPLTWVPLASIGKEKHHVYWKMK